MEIKIYKTTKCPACKMLVGMIPKGIEYSIYDVTKHPHKKPEGMSGAPYVLVDGINVDDTHGSWVAWAQSLVKD